MSDHQNAVGSETLPSLVPEKIVQVVSADPSASVPPPEVGVAPMVMSGDANTIAEEVSKVGPEGRPASPKTGPKLLRLEIFGLFGIVVVFAIVMGATLGWPAGLLSLAIGSLAYFFSPLFGATLARARDRQVVSDTHAVADRLVVRQGATPRRDTFTSIW